MHIFEPPETKEQPVVEISHWELISVTHKNGKETKHLVGLWDEEYGRISSPVLAINFSTGTATTLSGRTYVLKGPSGMSREAYRVLRNWLSMQGDPDYKIITEEFEVGQTKPAGGPRPN